MESRSGVTAFVPTFNRSVFLKEALESLLRQTLPPDEIFVIDDGSTDDTEQVAASFAPRVTYVRKANGGKSSALNAGLQHSSHELIYILDDDDIAADDAIERLAEVLRNHPECGFVYGEYDAFTVSDSGEISTTPRVTETADDDELSIALMHNNRIRQQCMLTRKCCYEHVGPFNEAFIRSQDYEMLLRLARNFQGKRLDHVVCHLRQHGGIRGSAAMPIAATDSYKAWQEFDAKAISAICTSYSLDEFLPRNVSVVTEKDRVTALLQRCVIVGRKRLWSHATSDLREACAVALRFELHELTPRQSLILQRLLDPSSDGLYDFASAGDFRSALLTIADPRLSKQICAALSEPLQTQIRQAIRDRSFRTLVYLTVCLICVSPGWRGLNYFGHLILKAIHRARSTREKARNRRLTLKHTGG